MLLSSKEIHKEISCELELKDSLSKVKIVNHFVLLITSVFLNVSNLSLNFSDLMSSIRINSLQLDKSNPVFHVCRVLSLKQVFLSLSGEGNDFKYMFLLMLDLGADRVGKRNVVNSLVHLIVFEVIDHVTHKDKVLL